MFKKFLQNKPDDVCFALASGRNFDLVKEVVEAYDLDVDFMIASVGTEIYYDTTKASKDDDWSAYLEFKWDREKIIEALKPLKWLELQEGNAQNPHKISYYCNPKVYDEERIKNRLENDWYHINVISHYYLNIL